MSIAGEEDIAFSAEDLPEIHQPAWTIKIKPEFEGLQLSASDSDDDPASETDVLDSL